MKNFLPSAQRRLAVSMAAVSAICFAGLMLAAFPVQAETPHSFVRVGASTLPVRFLDTTTVKTDGEVLFFDVLEANHLQTLPLHKPGEPQPLMPVPELVGQIKHHRVSCGWRTDRELENVVWVDASGNVTKTPHNDPTFSRDKLTHPFWELSAVVDELCEGRRLNNESVYPSIQSAMAQAKTLLPPPGPPPRPVAPPLAPAARIGEGEPHAFELVFSEGPGGNQLFVDRRSISRKGRLATGLSLIVLGADAHYSADFGFDNVVALRRVSYDCGSQSLTVDIQAYWNRFGEPHGQSEKSTPLRRAHDSPVIAAELAAVCAPSGSRTTTFATVDDAWAAARAQWPARPDRWKPACLWNALPEDVRTRFVDEWVAKGAESMKILSSEPLAGLMAACSVENEAPQQVGNRFASYAVQQAAGAVLSKSHDLDLQKILAAWNSLPWKDRQLFTKGLFVQTADSRSLHDALVYRVAKTLGLEAILDVIQLAEILNAQAYLTSS